MLGLLKAVVMLAPLLALASPVLLEPLSTVNDVTSRALITLDLAQISDIPHRPRTTLDLRVSESTTSCGNGNVTLNGKSLARDDDGIGSGFILVEDDHLIWANWKFTCVHLDQDSPAQLLSLNVASFEGQENPIAFSVQFRQTAPVSISYVDGATAELVEPDDQHARLEDELAELEVLKEQLRKLEHSVALKIASISETFGLDRPEELLRDGDSGSLHYKKLKDMVRKPALHGKNSSTTVRHGAHMLDRGAQYRLTDLNDPGKVSDRISSLHASGPVDVWSRINQNQTLRIVLPAVVVSLFLISLLVSLLCVRCLRQRRQDRREQRRRRTREPRHACNALVLNKSLDLMKWLRDGLQRQGLEDEEGQVIQGHIHEWSDGDDEEKMEEKEASMASDGEEDALSTTMEDDIAQFRVAAGVVSDLIAAHEGRGRLSGRPPSTRPRRDSTPSSITSACPTYRSTDDCLPPYEESLSPDYVADGFHYTSGTPESPTTNDTTTITPLDEGLGRKD